MIFAKILAVLSAATTASATVAAYWGQKTGMSLAQACDTSGADIMILAFLNDFGVSPASMNLAGNCDGISCPQVGKDIQHCQAAGKKVLLSLGGGIGSYGFNSDSDAKAFAETLWNMFGEGQGSNKPLAPGIVDGFDFDIENNNPKGYATLVNTLKSQYFSKASKKYYISAAPQCPLPDASLNDLLTNAPVDYAFIQFYNNPQCQVDSDGFNFEQWAQAAQSEFANKNMKLFVGLPGSASSAGSGYVSDISVLQDKLGDAKNYPSFGGVMFWDVYTATDNKIGGTSYLKAVKNIVG